MSRKIKAIVFDDLDNTRSVNHLESSVVAFGQSHKFLSVFYIFSDFVGDIIVIEVKGKEKMEMFKKYD